MRINLKEQNVFWTSDNHYGHANVMKYSDRPFMTDPDRLYFDILQLDKTRPSYQDAYRNFRPCVESVANMDKLMIERHNDTVTDQSIVFFNGDFAFASEERIIAILKQLRGHKHLTFGNHDEKIQKNKLAFIGPGLFETIRDYRELTVIEESGKKQKIILFHFGMRVWNHSHHGAWLLFGHSHGTLPPFGKSVDVGVDAPHVTGRPEYRPLSYREIKTFMDAQKTSVVDHHDENTS